MGKKERIEKRRRTGGRAAVSVAAVGAIRCRPKFPQLFAVGYSLFVPPGSVALEFHHQLR